jgi:hypothetical protein
MWHSTTSKWSRAIIDSPLAFASSTAALPICFAVGLSRATTASLLRATPGSNPSVDELRAVRDRHDASATQRLLNRLRKTFGLGETTMRDLNWARDAWLEASDAQKVAYLTIFLNITLTNVWALSGLGSLYGKGVTKIYASRVLKFIQCWFLCDTRPQQGMQH